MILALTVAVPLMGVYGGYQLGQARATATPEQLAQAWHDEVARQQAEVERAKQNAEDNLNALAIRLGQLQAQVARLNALGSRLTRLAEIEDGEFDFSSPPPQGGPATSVGETLSPTDFLAMLDELTHQLRDRERQLDVLDSMMISRNLQSEVYPSGRPIRQGWLSSPFGTRTDPFSGKKTFHHGIDFAAREGSDVIAVASGVVTFAGRRWGYGNMVEINHGNGYVTRYGHHKEILVEAGDRVEKGDAIALVGSTGRSTGPHVHFEVFVNGERVNPHPYVQTARSR